jgi:WD40 repeat protein
MAIHKVWTVLITSLVAIGHIWLLALMIILQRLVILISTELYSCLCIWSLLWHYWFNQVWDYQTKSCVQTLEGHAHNISAVCFHPELPIIITGSEDGTVRMWHSTTNRYCFSELVLLTFMFLAFNCKYAVILWPYVAATKICHQLLWCHSLMLFDSRLKGFDD